MPDARAPYPPGGDRDAAILKALDPDLVEVYVGADLAEALRAATAGHFGVGPRQPGSSFLDRGDGLGRDGAGVDLDTLLREFDSGLDGPAV